MTSGSDTPRNLGATIADVFAALIERGEIEVVPAEEGSGIEIQADQWTLAIEGDPPTVAFVAVDDEPASVEEMTAALDSVVEPDDLACLRDLNRRLNGRLRVALQESGDLLSLELASLLAEEPTGAE